MLRCCCGTVWSYCIKQECCSALTISSRQDQVVWLGGGTRGERARMAPTVHILRADGQEEEGCPEAPSDGCGSCRWVVCNLRTPCCDHRRSCCGATRPTVSSAATNGHLARFCLYRGKSGHSGRSRYPCPPPLLRQLRRSTETTDTPCHVGQACSRQACSGARESAGTVRPRPPLPRAP